MRKTFLLFALLCIAVAANAQFEKGTKYVLGNLNGLNMSYNGSRDFSVGLGVQAGYFVADHCMLGAQLGFQHEDVNQNSCVIGATARYYIIQNGFYGAVNVKGSFSEGRNDFMPGIEIGYSFFVNDKMTIEPAVYYDQSFSDHKDFSTVGLKIGLGFYF